MPVPLTCSFLVFPDLIYSVVQVVVQQTCNKICESSVLRDSVELNETSQASTLRSWSQSLKLNLK